MTCFNFQVDSKLLCGIERLQSILNFTCGEGITVTAEQGEKLGVTLRDSKAVIYYDKPFRFFRELYFSGKLLEIGILKEFEGLLGLSIFR